MKVIIRGPKQLDELEEKLFELRDKGKNPFWGMSYLDAIENMIDWLTNKEYEGDPLTDE